MLVNFINKLKKKSKEERSIYTFFIALGFTLVFVFFQFSNNFIFFDRYLLFTTTYNKNNQELLLDSQDRYSVADDIKQIIVTFSNSLLNFKKDDIFYNLGSDIKIDINDLKLNNASDSNYNLNIQDQYMLENIRKTTGNIEDTNKKIKIKINEIDFDVYLATNIQEHALGLSYSKELCQRCAMLFIFNESKILSFWMKDMNYNIDIIYLDQEGRVINIYENASIQSYENGIIYESLDKSKYVLEMNAGMAKSIGLKTGSIISINKYLKDMQ